MKHIPKQQWMGCAVAATAMLADVSYEEVAAHWPDLDEARMREPGQLCGLLEAVTDVPWGFSACWNLQPAVSQFSFPSWPVAVFIQDNGVNPRFGQWIVVRNEIVHDPGAWTSHVVARYPGRDWLVTYVAQPLRPEQFARSLARRRLQQIRNIFQSVKTDAHHGARR